jgi:uncharacterized membrane protein
MASSTLPPEDEFFRAVLYPHRSLDPRGFFILMSAIGLVSFGLGLVFLSMGAWPVFGFFGLDVALIYLAFRLNYRSGRQYEIISVDRQSLTLSRVDQKGEKIDQQFNPYWVQVQLFEKANGRTELALRSHGRDVGFGRFLNDDERRDFAKELKDALQYARATPPASAV